MKKILFLLTVVVFIQGCDVPMIQARQDYACSEHNGVYEYTNSVLFSEVLCRDGTWQRWNDRKTPLPEEFQPVSREHKE